MREIFAIATILCSTFSGAHAQAPLAPLLWMPYTDATARNSKTVSSNAIWATALSPAPISCSAVTQNATVVATTTPKRAPLVVSPVSSSQASTVIVTTSSAMKYGTLIASVAGEFDLDTNLLHALVQVESGYNANAVSSRGAIGLMQVIPATGARFGFFDLFDPQTNLRAGATYLAWLMSEFDNDLPLALAAYNAGEGSVHKSHDQIPPNRETRTYVRQVIEIYRKKQRTSSSQRSLSPKEVGSVRSTKSSQALRISAGKLLVKLGVLLLYGPNASKH